MAQATHSAIEFVFSHTETAKIWHETSDYIVILNIDNEEKLKELIDTATTKGIKHSFYREPDFNNQITSVALEPGNDTKKLCRGLKLALS
jgi:hypothetical protein